MVRTPARARALAAAGSSSGPRQAATRQSTAVQTNGRTTPPSYGNAGPADRPLRSNAGRSRPARRAHLRSAISTGTSMTNGHHLPFGLFLGVLTILMVMG